MFTTAILFASAFLLLSPPLLSSTAVADERPTAYEVLVDYHFPEGILPKGVTGYDLDPSTGKFHAYLNGSCSFSLEGSYQLNYKSTISGYISKDKLTSLTGVSVKVLLFWLNIVEVVRSGDDLEFSVGIASASFSLDNFFECPQCGCGLDCDTSQSFGKFSKQSGGYNSLPWITNTVEAIPSDPTCICDVLNELGAGHFDAILLQADGLHCYC